MSQREVNLTAPPQVYRARRARLASELRRPMVIAAGRARARQYATNTYPFRAGSSYLYFGGPPVEGAAWLIEPGSDGDEGSRLLRTPTTLEDAVWIGAAPSDEVLAAAAGVSVKRLDSPDRLTTLLAIRDACYVAPPCPPTLTWLAECGVQPADDQDLLPIVRMRLIKDEHELAAMRRAAAVAVEAHLAAMRTTAAGKKVAEVAGAIEAVLTARECTHSFTPAVTISGEVLHADGCHGVLEPGRLLLVDAGAEEPGGYASDITRTWPVNGRFSGIQRALYDTVHRAEQAAIAACRPGARYRDVHDVAARVICEGLVHAGLLRGDPATLFEQGAHTLFFTHGVGHLLGLDVHDMEDFGDLAGYAPGRTRRPEFGNKFLRLDRDLEPGMVVTIEPGIYLVPQIWQDHTLAGRYPDAVNRLLVERLLGEHFGGIRIEDDVHVLDPLADAPEVLTGELPAGADAIVEVLARS